MHDDTTYTGRDAHVPTVALARDPFTDARRRLEGNPAAVKTQSRLDVADDYDNVATWIIDQYRHDGKTIALVQIVSASGGTRLVLPPAVTKAIAAGQASLATRNRSRVGKLQAAKRRADGLPVGNPEALKLARKARRHK